MTQHKRFDTGHVTERTPEDPSPAEIRRICEKIRSRWSPAERDRRAGAQKPRAWMPPIVRGVDLPPNEDPVA